MVQNIVLNNSDRTFGAIADHYRIDADQTRVNATPGTDAAVNAQLRAELESGALTASGAGININHAA